MLRAFSGWSQALRDPRESPPETASSQHVHHTPKHRSHGSPAAFPLGTAAGGLVSPPLHPGAAGRPGGSQAGNPGIRDHHRPRGHPDCPHGARPGDRRRQGPGTRELVQAPEPHETTSGRLRGTAARGYVNRELATVSNAAYIEGWTVLIKTHKIALVTNNRQASLLASGTPASPGSPTTPLWPTSRPDWTRANGAGTECCSAGSTPSRRSWPPGPSISQNAGKYAIVDLGQAIDAFGAYRRAVKAGKKVRRVGFPRFHRRGLRCCGRVGAWGGLSPSTGSG